MNKSRNGTTLLETAITLAIITTMTLALINPAGRLKDLITGTGSSPLDSAVALERVIAVLTNARSVLYPRATNGASRGKMLVFLDEKNRLSTIICDGQRLVLRKRIDRNTIEETALGSCEAILFHDRGKTRRCLRIRASCSTFLAATTVLLINTPVSFRLCERKTGALSEQDQ